MSADGLRPMCIRSAEHVQDGVLTVLDRQVPARGNPGHRDRRAPPGSRSGSWGSVPVSCVGASMCCVDGGDGHGANLQGQGVVRALRSHCLLSTQAQGKSCLCALVRRELTPGGHQQEPPSDRKSRFSLTVRSVAAAHAPKGCGANPPGGSGAARYSSRASASGCGEIGIHAGFRCLWALRPWRFESSQPHSRRPLLP